MSEDSPSSPGFQELGLSSDVLKALDDVGYETPSSIQAQVIPLVLEGRDVVGQAQTGTGKTAAFALPLLTHIDTTKQTTQVLVLVPTRELAIQVSEAFQRYAAHIPGFHVMPIYGGQAYGGQLRQLRRGVHVIVATPGRLCDHLRRETLSLKDLECMVIDEADEMLRMGFIEEVEWILEQTPPTRQVTLFSATMPAQIRRIASKHLRNAAEVTIREKTSTASTIHQRYWMVSGMHKLDALTRILEFEEFDAMLIFVRTKTAAVELADRLEARGFACAPLNGDIPQNMREQTIDRLRSGDLDILVATDVAARGLDVLRITHVVNFDIPYDAEAYIHRVGRTGRAGREGQAILFVAPRERRLLLAIEQATRQKITMMQLPSREAVNDIRVARFKQRITDTLAAEELGFYSQVLEEYCQEQNVPALEVASALARLLQGETPLLMSEEKPEPEPWKERPQPEIEKAPRKRPRIEGPRPGMQVYRIDVGRVHGVKAGSIVGAIANEAGLTGAQIGRIGIEEEYCTVELAEGLTNETLAPLKRTRVCGRPLKIELATGSPAPSAKPAYRPRIEKYDAYKPKSEKPSSYAPKTEKSSTYAPKTEKKSGYASKYEKAGTYAAKAEKPFVKKRPKAAADSTLGLAAKKKYTRKPKD